MRIVFKNNLKLDKSAVGLPLKLEETPVGTIVEVTESNFSCEIWDDQHAREFLRQDVLPVVSISVSVSDE
jgi:hypothetical protein